MATVYDSVDLQYVWNGDYLPGADGDIADTASDQIQSLIQEIQTIANSSLGDWEEHPQYAASLDDFIGEPNNRDTARLIADRLRTALVSNNVVRADDLAIKVIPTERSKLLIVVGIQAAATENNSIIQGAPAVVVLVYDYMERGVFFVEFKQE